jgi:hypothetical protein
VESTTRTRATTAAVEADERSVNSPSKDRIPMGGKRWSHSYIAYCCCCCCGWRRPLVSWIQLICISAVLGRILCQFYHIHQTTSQPRILDYNSNFVNSLWTPPPILSSSLPAQRLGGTTTAKQQQRQDLALKEDYHRLIEQRRLKRQQRTRPPSSSFNATMTPARTIDLWNETTIRVNHGITDWSLLCHEAGLSSDSRVVITGILTPASAGPALALLLSKQCHVSKMIGVDPMQPNVRSVRLQAMNVYQQLYRNIPHFQLIVPTAIGLSSVRKKPQNETKQELDWMHQFHPTHVIHLEPTATGHADLMSASNQQLY